MKNVSYELNIQVYKKDFPLRQGTCMEVHIKTHFSDCIFNVVILYSLYLLVVSCCLDSCSQVVVRYWDLELDRITA